MTAFQIGPNRCQECGGVYGEHKRDCETPKGRYCVVCSPAPRLEAVDSRAIDGQALVLRCPHCSLVYLPVEKRAAAAIRKGPNTEQP